MELSEDGKRALADIAGRYTIGTHAVKHLFAAVLAGGGFQAQFNHPDLGGMGQWSSGGMTMIGDMFNGNLKSKVADICAELAHLSRNDALRAPQPPSHQAQYQGDGTSLFVEGARRGANWWPEALGFAASTGAQNDLRYAVFPSRHRLAISVHGQVTIYDTGDHQISGFSQQQGGDQSVGFTSQHGLVRVAELRQIPLSDQAAETVPEADVVVQATPAPPSPQAADKPSAALEDDIFTKIERLAALHAKGILQDEEFHAKKRELLDRL